MSFCTYLVLDSVPISRLDRYMTKTNHPEGIECDCSHDPEGICRGCMLDSGAVYRRAVKACVPCLYGKSPVRVMATVDYGDGDPVCDACAADIEAEQEERRAIQAHEDALARYEDQRAMEHLERDRMRRHGHGEVA